MVGEGFLVNVLIPIKGVDVDVAIVFGEDEPLMIIGNGCSFIPHIVDLECLEELETINCMIIAVYSEV